MSEETQSPEVQDAGALEATAQASVEATIEPAQTQDAGPAEEDSFFDFNACD